MYIFKNIFSIFFILLVIGISSCKEDKAQATDVALEETIEDLEKVANADPSIKNVGKLIEAVVKELKQKDIDSEKEKSLLVKGIDYCKKYNKTNYAATFYMPILKKQINKEKANDYVFELGSIMKSMNKKSASDVLFSNFATLYPNDPRVEEAKSNVSENFGNMEQYLKSQADLAFKRESGKDIDKKVVQAYVDACEAYALSNPNGSETPKYLYKGSELARSIKSTQKVLSLYDWIIDKYPNFEKTPTVHFLKGFIIENDAGNAKAAKVVYESFLEKYPEHELADDVKFLIKNLGKSNEEILKMLGKDGKK